MADSRSRHAQGAVPRRRWSSPPADSRCRRSARRRSVTASPSSSASPSFRRGRRWCRSRSTPERARALRRSLRRVGRRRSDVQRRALSRERAVHASRAVGPGDPADLVVLARRRSDRTSTCSRTSMRRRWLARSATLGARMDDAARATAAEALRAAVVRGARRRRAAAQSSSDRAHRASSTARCTTGRCSRRGRSATTRPR